MTFHVGQKVVCVDAGDINGFGCRWMDDDAPTVGSVYTVTSIHADCTGDTVFHLVEIPRGPIARRQWGESAGYNVVRFRPVVERKTDISIFTAMLTGSKIGADA